MRCSMPLAVIMGISCCILTIHIGLLPCRPTLSRGDLNCQPSPTLHTLHQPTSGSSLTSRPGWRVKSLRCTRRSRPPSRPAVPVREEKAGASALTPGRSEWTSASSYRVIMSKNEGLAEKRQWRHHLSNDPRTDLGL